MGSVGTAVLQPDVLKELSVKVNQLPYEQVGHGDTRNLFPYVRLKDVLSDVPANFDPYKPENQKDGVVRVDTLKSTQDYLSVRNLTILESALRTTPFDDLYDKRYPNETSVIVLKKGNDHIVYDGNHRAALAKLLGKKTIKVKIVEV